MTILAMTCIRRICMDTENNQARQQIVMLSVPNTQNVKSGHGMALIKFAILNTKKQSTNKEH